MVCLLLHIRSPFLPCSASWGTDLNKQAKRLLCPLVQVGFGRWGDLGGTRRREDSEVKAPFLQGAWAIYSPAYSQSFHVIFIQPCLPAHQASLRNSLRFWKAHGTPNGTLYHVAQPAAVKVKLGAGVFVCFIQMKSRRERILNDLEY